MACAGRGGVIVNIGSSSTNGGRAEQGAYAASKAGIQCLTETLALEGKEQGGPERNCQAQEEAEAERAGSRECQG